MDFAVLGGNRHHLGAAPGHGAHILVAAAVQLHNLGLGGIELLDRVGDGEIHDLGGFVQAQGMFARFENGAAIGALAFKNGGAIMQAVGEHMDLGIFPFDDFAVQPDGAVALVKWNDGHRNSPNSIFIELQPICTVKHAKSAICAITLRAIGLQRNKNGIICQYG